MRNLERVKKDAKESILVLAFPLSAIRKLLYLAD